ncbi:MAG: transposase [Synergistaceae bacterium]|nr:transposase [Synergistaceae bacterium]NLY87106.1 transposase [Clostridiales bacterium]
MQKQGKKQKKKLEYWLLLAETSGLKEFHECIHAHKNWKEEILRHFETGLTNGRTEGFNNLIKVIKRISFGIPNFMNVRRRILFCSAIGR